MYEYSSISHIDSLGREDSLSTGCTQIDPRTDLTKIDIDIDFISIVCYKIADSSCELAAHTTLVPTMANADVDADADADASQC
jgi:hypothetical protein